MIISCTTYNNLVTLTGSSTRQSPKVKNKVSVCRNMSIKPRDSFNWANSETETASRSSISVTPNFILPVETRPNLKEVSKTSIPVIDMGKPESAALVQEIARASEEYGLFFVTNHGIPQQLCDSMLSALVDLFHLPPRAKSLLVSDDQTTDVRISNYFINVEDDNNNQKGKRVNMWSEFFKHPWHPTDDTFTLLLPSDPPHYRDIMRRYAKDMGVLMSRLLNLMSQGLGLEGDYLIKVLGEKPLYRAQGNYYPPCSNPELTLGLDVHTDRDALTVIVQTPNVTGLQIIKDNKWVAVDPVPNTLIIDLGDQLEVLSNGKYKSVVHRVVTNEHQHRASLAMFYGPDKDAFIGPIQTLIDQQHPPIYRHYYFREFLEEFRRQEGKNHQKIKEAFEI